MPSEEAVINCKDLNSASLAARQVASTRPIWVSVSGAKSIRGLWSQFVTRLPRQKSLTNKKRT